MLDLSSIALSSATKAMLNERNFLDPSDRLTLGMNEKGNRFVARLNDSNGHFSSRSANYWAEATPGATRVKKRQPILGDYWSLHASDFSVLRIAHSWNDSQITYADDLTAVTYANVYARFLAGEANAKRIDEWHNNGESIELPETIQGKLKFDLPPNSYQTVAAKNGIASNGFGMLMEQGTGKTYPTILVMADQAARCHARGAFFKGLVVCPNNVRLNWEREIAKFSPVPLVSGTVIGDQSKRIAKLVELFCNSMDDEIYGAVAVASYQAAAEICLILKHLGISIDICVLDESHTIKNPAAAITKNMHAGRDIFIKRLVLTGTPIGNNAFDLWAQLEFIYPCCSGFDDFPSFKKYYSKNVPSNATTEEKLAAIQNMPLLRERLARNTFVVSKKVALPYLPEKVWDIVSIPLSKKQKEAYDTLAEHLALEIEADLEAMDHDGKNRTVVINNALTKSLKLTQITSGFIKWDAVVHPVSLEEISPAWEEEFQDNPKCDWLIEEIKNSPKDEKFIVWCYQIFGQDIILRRLQEAGIGVVRFNGNAKYDERNKMIDAFNDEILKTNPKAYDPLNSPVKVFLANAAAAGAGSNLIGYPIGRPDLSPCNACRVIRYAYNYSHIERAQSDDRSHRVGTRVTQRYTTLIGQGTIERKIHSILEAKADSAASTTDLRDILAELARVKDD